MARRRAWEHITMRTITINTNRKAQLGAVNRVIPGNIGLVISLPSAAYVISAQSLPTTVMKGDDASGTVTIQAPAGETINGQLTYVLGNQFQYATFAASGGNWVVVGNN